MNGEKRLPERTPSPEPARPSELAPLLDADGRVATDVACRQCRYNLRTLHVESCCPECGTAVIKTLDRQRAYTSWVGETSDALASSGRAAAGIAIAAGVAHLLVLTQAETGFLAAPVLAGFLLAALCGMFALATTTPPPGARKNSLSAGRLMRLTLYAWAIGLFGAAAAFLARQWLLGGLFLLLALPSLMLFPAALLWHVSGLMSHCGREDLRTGGRGLAIVVLLIDAIPVLLLVTSIGLFIVTANTEEWLLVICIPAILVLSLVGAAYLIAASRAMRALERRLQAAPPAESTGEPSVAPAPDGGSSAGAGP